MLECCVTARDRAGLAMVVRGRPFSFRAKTERVEAERPWSWSRAACKHRARSGLVMDSEDRKNNVGDKTRVEDLERVVKVRKYQHCEAEYSRLAKEPNTMPQARPISQNRSILSRAGRHGTCWRIGDSPSFIPTPTVSQAPSRWSYVVGPRPVSLFRKPLDRRVP